MDNGSACNQYLDILLCNESGEVLLEEKFLNRGFTLDDVQQNAAC